MYNLVKNTLYCGELSLSQNLENFGYFSREKQHVSQKTGERDILDSTGDIVFTGNYAEVAAWLKDQEASETKEGRAA